MEPRSDGSSTTDTHAKALALNLDPSIYGSFAEIGAGQDVANWFLRVGAASGTVAQTICAYDKAFSDDRYGKGTRYVSRERLLAMLEREYTLLRTELGPSRPGSRFFSFAETVAARNFKGDNEQHGWVGLRFETEPGGPTHDILLHAALRDPTADEQRESLGVFGVNLIDAAYHHLASPTEFLKSLFEGLSRKSLEVDVIELGGPGFAGADGRRWCLQALRLGMCHAVVFDRTGRPVEPAAVLRKRPLIVERGRFESSAPDQANIYRSAETQLRSEGQPLKADPAAVLEMTVTETPGAPGPEDAAILTRVDRLAKLGVVVVSDLAQGYLLVDYLRRHTSEPIRVALAVSTLAQMLIEDYSAALPGSLLEGLGKLLAENVKIYCYPVPVETFRKLFASEAAARIFSPPSAGVLKIDDLCPQPPLDHLLRYLRAAGWVVPIDPV